MKRIEFRLSMPNVGSWNGKWSGQGRNYVLYQNLSDAKCEELAIGAEGRRWYHRWDDGWGAGINARVMDKGERKPKSDGFCGYEWMVDNILSHNSPYGKDKNED